MNNNNCGISRCNPALDGKYIQARGPAAGGGLRGKGALLWGAAVTLNDAHDPLVAGTADEKMAEGNKGIRTHSTLARKGVE